MSFRFPWGWSQGGKVLAALSLLFFIDWQLETGCDVTQGWPGIHYVAGSDLELLILLPPPPERWGLRACTAMPSL